MNERNFRQIGTKGANLYQNGRFVASTMGDWAFALKDTYETYQNAAILSKLVTSGMTKDEAATYKAGVTKELNHLSDKGWSEKGLAAYVSYLNRSTEQDLESAAQNSELTSTYYTSNYTLQMTALILDHINSLTIVKNDIKDDNKRTTYMQYWVNGLPSDFFTQVGDYIPNLHAKTQKVETDVGDEGVTQTTVDGELNSHYNAVLHPLPSLKDELLSSAGMLLFVGAQFVPGLNDVVNGVVVGNSAAKMIESGKLDASDVATIVALIGAKGIGGAVNPANIAKAPDEVVIKSELNAIKNEPNANFSINSKGNAVEHIFEGEMKIRPNGDIYIQGAHYEPSLNPDIEAQITKKIPDPPLKNEPYQVIIDGKNQPSTMFPKNWTPQQVDQAIQEAYDKGKYIAKDAEGTNYKLFTTKDGYDIRIDLNPQGKIVSAYPY